MQVLFSLEASLNQITENSPSAPSGDHPMSNEERDQDQAKVLIEKKTVVNLLEAYAVAVKHYLRGEDGIRYTDLYPLVSFLPSYYSLPAIIPSLDPPELRRRATYASTHSRCDVPSSPVSKTQEHKFQIPLPPIPETSSGTVHGSFSSESTVCDEESILPASIPPKHSWQAAFPFSFFLWIWTIMKNDARKAIGVDGAGRNFRPNENNVPMEISLFLVRRFSCAKISQPDLYPRKSSYISALQVRKTADVPTISTAAETVLCDQG
jgi:putative membrane protein